MEAILDFFTGTLYTIAWIYILLPCVILGGIKRIGRITELLIPFMSILRINKIMSPPSSAGIWFYMLKIIIDRAKINIRQQIKLQMFCRPTMKSQAEKRSIKEVLDLVKEKITRTSFLATCEEATLKCLPSDCFLER